MHRITIIAALLLITSVVQAQDTPVEPLSALEAGTFSALAFNVDATRLVAANEDNETIRVFSLDNPASPSRIASVSASATPLLLAMHEAIFVGSAFDGIGTVEVIGRSRFAQTTPYSGGLNFIDLPAAPTALALSPDGEWGVTVYENGYTLMQISDPSEIISQPFDGSVTMIALTNSAAYILRDNLVESAPLRDVTRLTPNDLLRMQSRGTALAIRPQADFGVAAQDDGLLVIFELTGLDPLATFRLDGGGVFAISFASGGDRDLMIIAQEGARDALLIDVTNPRDPVAIGRTPALDGPLRAIAARDGLIAITDGTLIRIFGA